MDSQDSRFTTPPPRIHGLYNIDTPPSTQPRSPPFEIPISQQTTQSWDSRNGSRPQISESQQTIQSWDSRDLLPDSQLLLDSLFNESIPSPPLFVLDSQSQPSQGSNGSCWPRAPDCSRDTRVQIQTALLFKIPLPIIMETLDVTEAQIIYAKKTRLTPQKTKGGRHAKLHTPEKTTLKEWLLSSPSHRHVAYHKIPRYLPQLHASEKAIRTAIDGITYYRRVAKKKGFSDDPAVCHERLDIAENSITWPLERVQRICFTDEVWAFGGAHTNSYVTVLKDGSDRLLSECLRHKYSKLPAWMF
jgi:hypothetical protein